MEGKMSVVALPCSSSETIAAFWVKLQGDCVTPQPPSRPSNPPVRRQGSLCPCGPPTRRDPTKAN